MPLNNEDLQAIKEIVNDSLKDIRNDLKSMKADIKLLATLNQLDEIKKDSRLRVLYSQEENQQEA